MRGLAIAAVLALAACGQGAAPAANVAEAKDAVASGPVKLTAADGVTVYGWQTSPAHPRAVVLLFHQAGSSKDEYTPIARPLADVGFASLAIDQRAGGDMYGLNQTVQGLGRQGDYLAAKQDLEAALAWAKARKLPVILWGSSYSSSLVFLVAAEHPGEVAALLAFSPDEYFEDKHSVHAAAAKLTIPIFVTSAQDPGEIAAAKSLLDAAPSMTKVQFVPEHGGVHGSSTLRADRNPQGAREAWSAVIGFLKRVVP